MKKILFLSLFLVFIVGCGCSSTSSGTSDKVDYKKVLLEEHETEYTDEKFLLAVQFNNYEIVELFLKAGIDPETEDMVGRRVMYTAVGFNSVEAIDLLFEYGADPLFTNEYGVGYIQFAAINRQTCDTMKALVRGGTDLYLKYESGSNALDSSYAQYEQYGSDYSEQISCLEELGLTRTN